MAKVRDCASDGPILYSRVSIFGSKCDECFYRGRDVWLLIFVDDIILIGKELSDLDSVNDLPQYFHLKDMCELHSFLWVYFRRIAGSAQMSHGPLFTEIQKRFGMY